MHAHSLSSNTCGTSEEVCRYELVDVYCVINYSQTGEVFSYTHGNLIVRSIRKGGSVNKTCELAFGFSSVRVISNAVYRRWLDVLHLTIQFIVSLVA